MTQNKTVQPDTGRLQEEMKELGRNKKIKIEGRKERLETFCP